MGGVRGGAFGFVDIYTYIGDERTNERMNEEIEGVREKKRKRKERKRKKEKRKT